MKRIGKHWRAAGTTAFFVALLGGSVAPSITAKADAPPSGSSSAAPAAQAPSALRTIRFEPNRGQTSSAARFIVRSGGSSAFLTDTDAVFVVAKPGTTDTATAQGADLRSAPKSPAPGSGVAVVRMHMRNANPNAQITAEDQLPGRSNYLIGSDSRKWVTSVPAFAQVRYHSIYPGIDLVYHSGADGNLEYDFVAAPGASTDAIDIEFQGADGVAAASGGGIDVATSAGKLTQRAPTLYQQINGSRHVVTGGYSLRAGNRVGFSVGAHDPSQALVIDPLLSYSTYLGGSTGDGNAALSIVSDSSGDAFVTGYVVSVADFPTTTGSFQPSFPAIGSGRTPTSNAFVTKLSPNGSSLLYSTYLGGSTSGGCFFCGDRAFGIAIDPAGEAYVAGDTTSSDFPTTPSGLQRSLQGAGGASGERNGFFAKLNAQGSGLLYGTYLGGAGNVFHAGDQAVSVGVDASGNALVAGSTASPNFPVTANAFQAACRSNCAVNHDGAISSGSLTTLTSATADFNAFDAGSPISGTNIPANTAINTVNSPTSVTLSNAATGPGTGLTFTIGSGLRGGANAFLTKLDPAKSGTSSLVYSTLLGGGSLTSVSGMSLDASGNAYLTGFTHAADFPTTAGVYKPACTTCTTFSDGTIDADGVTLHSPTANFSSADVGGDIFGPNLAVPTHIASVTNATTAVLDTHSIRTGATTFTLPDRRPDGASFVAKLNPAKGKSALVYATFFGDQATGAAGVAVDTHGNAYVTGQTTSATFPTTATAFDRTFKNTEMGFVSKFNPGATGLVYSTYLGGTDSSPDFGIAVTSAGSAVVVGQSFAGTTYPLKNQVAAFGGNSDATVTQLNSSGSKLVFSSFLGGGSSDRAGGVAVDTHGVIHLAGNTTSNNFPVTAGVFQPHFGGDATGRLGNAFVVAIAPSTASTPSVTGITPQHGSLSGGTSAVISGSGFSNVSAVRFGGVAATKFTVNSTKKITAVIPSQVAPPSGTTLVVGVTVTTSGGTSPDNPVDQFTYGEGSWTATRSLSVARRAATATLLSDGRVLVAGGATSGPNGEVAVASAEIYTPATGKWTSTGSLNVAREAASATLLTNGKVLVVGGDDDLSGTLASAELFDPKATTCGATGCWTLAASMPTSLEGHTATLLTGGKVLVAGGQAVNGPLLASAFEYDPNANTWTAVGSMATARSFATATLLSSGKVLVAGGCCPSGTDQGLASAELFDPAAKTWSSTGSMGQARLGHTATLLPSGKVMVAGGGTLSGPAFTSIEEYDPVATTWSLVGVLQHARKDHDAALLPDGKVLITGGLAGSGTNGLQTAELFDQANPATTIAADEMSVARGQENNVNFGSDGPSFTLTLLSTGGKVLATGGSGDASAELFVDK